MLATTARLLELLEMLQERPVTAGGEIADRLAVDRRTVRRYIAALQALGIPVEGERGAGGGYRLRPGYRLPPLMLTDDEAVAAVLGLSAARRLGLDIAADGADRALAKIHRVLPATLRRRVEALQATLGFTVPATPVVPVAGQAVLELAAAIRLRQRVRASYESFTGTLTGRELSPHGLVVHAGRWYLAAYDHGRGALRTFRVDRMRHITVTTGAAADPGDGFDAVAYVSRSLARVPWTWQVEVLLHAPPQEVAPCLPAALAELAADGDGTLLRMRVDSLDWMAGILAGLGCDFTVRAPGELRARVRALADRLARSA